MKKIIITVLVASSLMSCTLSDRVGYSYLDKAELTLNYQFTKDEDFSKSNEEIESLELYIFDGNGMFFRQESYTHSHILPNGIYQTYLPNDNYTIVSWVNADENTTLPTCVAGDCLEDITLKVKGSRGEFNTMDDLMYNCHHIRVQKGDKRDVTIDLSKLTYHIDLKITGLESLEAPESYYFGTENCTEINFNDQKGNCVEMYKPTLSYNGGVAVGEFKVLQFAPEATIPIGIFSKETSEKHFFSADLNSLIPQYIKDDMLSGKTLSTKVQIDVHEEYISIKIEDFEVAKIQIENLGE